MDEPSYEDDDRGFSRRAAGFDIDDTPYEMDSDRYVPAPKKKGIGGLLFIAILELLAAAGLIGWWLGWGSSYIRCQGHRSELGAMLCVEAFL